MNYLGRDMDRQGGFDRRDNNRGDNRGGFDNRQGGYDNRWVLVLVNVKHFSVVGLDYGLVCKGNKGFGINGETKIY